MVKPGTAPEPLAEPLFPMFRFQTTLRAVVSALLTYTSLSYL